MPFLERTFFLASSVLNHVKMGSHFLYCFTSQINGNATIMEYFSLMNLYCHFGILESNPAFH